MTDVADARSQVPAQPRPGTEGPRQARPVVIWAVVGGLSLALTAYQWAAWILRGHAKPSPVGDTPIPDWLQVSLVIWQIVFPLAAVAWFNYTRQWFNYNAALFNLGCPQCEVPGWQSPHPERVAEPLFVLSLYMFALFTGCVLCNKVMRAAKARWPRIGPVGLVGVALGTMALADVVCEIVWARTGTFSYVAAIPGVTLFAGHYYQYPVTQAIIWGFPWGLIACLRYFRNDRGETLGERGINKVKVGPAKKTAIRLLAVIGILNTVFFLTSNIPNQIFGTHAGAVPRDILERSYLLNGQCGPGTDQACPGPRVPMPVGPDSAHATPDGGFDSPKGLPNQEAGEK